jgi:hypothetical protein
MLSDISAQLSLYNFTEVEGSRRSSSERGLFRGTRVFVCDWTAVNIVENALMGYPLGSQTGIFWTNADPWPGRQDAVCRTVSVEGFGRVSGTGPDGLTYTKAKITASYTNQIDAFNNPDQQDGQPVDSSSVTIAQASYAGEFVNMSKKKLQFTGSAKAVPPDLQPTALLRRATLTIPIQNSNIAPIRFGPYIGRINSVAIFGLAIKTVLYEGADSTQKRISVPYVAPPAVSPVPPAIVDVWDYSHKFVYQDVGFEKFIDPDSGNWDTLSIVGGGQFQPFGAAVDLNKIFSKEP